MIRVAGVVVVVKAMIARWRRERGSGGDNQPSTKKRIDVEAIYDAERRIWEATQQRFFGDVVARKDLTALNPFKTDNSLWRC